MDLEASASKKTKHTFRSISTEDRAKLLIGKDKLSTQRATEGYINQFKTFLAAKNYKNLEDIDVKTELNEILVDFYSSIKPVKSDDYSVQTLKCIRSGLNRWFRKERGIDISSDSLFVQANEMLQAVKVKSKKAGKGMKNSTVPITDIDLERIAEYFCHDHASNPNPRKLQQNMIFYIIYYFCRRGRENLYTMDKDTFKLVTENDGKQFYIQAHDEMDKNHGIKDTDKNNDSKMFATNSK